MGSLRDETRSAVPMDQLKATVEAFILEGARVQSMLEHASGGKCRNRGVSWSYPLGKPEDDLGHPPRHIPPTKTLVGLVCN